MAIEHGQKCPSCDKKLTKYAWHSTCHHCGAHFAGAEVAPPTAPPAPVVLMPGQKEYRVITQADQWFMGKFSPDRMNVLLNTLAAGGWRLVAVATADRATWFGSFGGTTRQEMVMFLEREVIAETTVQPFQEGVADKL